MEGSPCGKLWIHPPDRVVLVGSTVRDNLQLPWWFPHVRPSWVTQWRLSPSRGGMSQGRGHPVLPCSILPLTLAGSHGH